jgi:single-stranded-DNA-specific exonuclease
MLSIFLTQLGYKIIPLLHSDKKHGLSQEIMDTLLTKEPSLLWIADAGTNDTEQCKQLSELGWKIIISDHHISEQDNPYAIIVNNQMSPNVINKQGCGATVTWHCIHNINPQLANSLISYVMIATLGDSMSLASQENRCFIKWGKLNIHPNLQPFVDELNKDDTNRGYSFGLITNLNSLIRLGALEEKEELFKALCGEVEPNNIIEVCKKYHTKQQNESTKLADSIEIDNSKNIIIGEIDNTPLTGLVANKIMSKYNKPTILVHKDNKQYVGSMRSPIEFKDIINESKCATSAGHNSASGVFINDMDKFKDYIYSVKLCEPCIEVLQSYVTNSIPNELFSLKSIGNKLWGMGIQEPTFHIHSIHINSSQIKELGNGLTIKFTYQGVDFIHFFTSNKLKEELHMDKPTKIILNVIGTLDWNEFRGRKTKQVIMDKIECEVDNKMLSFEDLF